MVIIASRRSSQSIFDYMAETNESISKSTSAMGSIEGVSSIPSNVSSPVTMNQFSNNAALHNSVQLPNNSAHYTLPGILHHLHLEHGRFETQRNYWEIERAELKVLS
jgi:hypothetical protein